MHCSDTWKRCNLPPPKCKTSWLCSVFMLLGSVRDPYLSNSMGIGPLLSASLAICPLRGRRHHPFDVCPCYAAGSFAAADCLWLRGSFLTRIGWLLCSWLILMLPLAARPKVKWNPLYIPPSIQCNWQSLSTNHVLLTRWHWSKLQLEFQISTRWMCHDVIKVLVLRSFSVSGIRVGLKMLTVLFIGGASGSAQLLGCQRTDGAGGWFSAQQMILVNSATVLVCSAWYSFSGTPLKEFAFRPLFPHERCEEALWVWSLAFWTIIQTNSAGMCRDILAKEAPMGPPKSVGWKPGHDPWALAIWGG